MCGLAGIHRFRSGRPVLPEELAAMSALLVHRGPDDEGTFRDGALGLAHRRLTILDVTRRGRQPMTTPDGDVVVAFNGEIYNYLELRHELETKGTRFRSGTDTEVLLELYRHEGPALVDRLNGMFAFAIWDARRRRLTLARDRLGIKPLYWAETAEGIVFASEIKPLLAALPDPPSLDPERLDAYMSVGYVPGDRTLLAGIRKLPPGWLLTVEDGRISARPYWSLSFADDPDLRDPDDAVAKARALLEDAVRIQLRSDVPLGVFLSGGIDSSAVVALMAELGIEDIATFTVGYRFGRDFDESGPARRVAERFRTRHHEVFVTPEMFRDTLPAMVRHMEEPVTEAAAISLFHVAALARRHVKVVLSGEGSDEVFGGYPIYAYMMALERYRRLPRMVRRRVAGPLLARLGPKWAKYVDLGERPLERRYLGVSFYEPPLKEALYGGRRRASGPSFADEAAGLYRRTEGEHPLRRMMHLDVTTWLPDDLLIKADKMTMAHGLELRVPFLDHRLVELGAALPPRWRVRRWQTKPVLKRAMEGLLPREIVHRRKMGFPTPLAALFRGGLRETVLELVDPAAPPLADHFEPQVVRRLVADHLAGARDHHRVLWQLMVLSAWHREMVAGPSATARAEPA